MKKKYKYGIILPLKESYLQKSSGAVSIFVNEYLKIPREKFNHLMNHTHEIDQILEDGAERARMVAKDTMSRVRSRITGF